jgi:hypothetical protein
MESDPLNFGSADGTCDSDHWTKSIVICEQKLPMTAEVAKLIPREGCFSVAMATFGFASCAGSYKSDYYCNCDPTCHCFPYTTYTYISTNK